MMKQRTKKRADFIKQRLDQIVWDKVDAVLSNLIFNDLWFGSFLSRDRSKKESRVWKSLIAQRSA